MQKSEIPKYFTVKEVSMLTGLSPQIICRHCSDKKYKACQENGENGIWLIESEQFQEHPSWDTFIQKRNEMFARSKRVAELALELWYKTDTDEEEQGEI